MSKEEIEIAYGYGLFDDGQMMVKVQAERHGALALHPVVRCSCLPGHTSGCAGTYFAPRTGWVVTHVPTGTRIGPPLGSRRAARRFLQLLEPLADWRRVKEQKRGGGKLGRLVEEARLQAGIPLPGDLGDHEWPEAGRG